MLDLLGKVSNSKLEFERKLLVLGDLNISITPSFFKRELEVNLLIREDESFLMEEE